MVAGVFILLIKRRKRMTLNIDQESCIKCGKCVRVCPSDIFTQERAGETIGLVRVTPFQPDIDLEARTQGDAGQDRGGRSFCADGYKLPKPFVYRCHRSAKATAGERLYDRCVRLLGEAIIESRREMCGQAVYEGCL